MFILLWNVITFLLMGWDKQRAKSGKGRVSERTLLLCTFLMGGGGIGTGMLCFNHKTRKWKFRILVPTGILVNFMVILGIMSIVNA